jgi:transposase
VVTTPATLPDNVAALRALVLAAWAERDAERAENARLSHERDQLAGQNDRLRHLIRQLQRMQFGRRSEKLDRDQLALGLEDLEQAVAAAEAEAEKTDPTLRRARATKRRTSRGALPDHLPRVEVVIEPDDTACPCCGGTMHVIGEDRSQRLDVIPAQYQVIVMRRPKYACRACQAAVVQAPAPARLIEGGLPSERLVAHVVIAKYADHCPLYRQAQILARQGIAIDRATLAFWVGYAAAEIKPLWRLMREELLRSTKLFVDETTAPVLDPGRGRTKTGYLWVLARDDRPWQGDAPPAVVYNYAPGRGAEHAVALLQGFAGVLQTDGYVAYRNLADPKRTSEPATLAFCWAHWRRQWFDIAKSPPAPTAAEALKRIAELYEIEGEIRGKSADERRAVRQQKTKPLAEALRAWLEKALAQVAGGSSIAQAIRYAPNRWDGLVRFLDDGRIEIDSNTVERAMRPIALSRKNALFAGSDEGAENWAMLASLIKSCKLHAVNPEAYLTDVLSKLVNNWPNSRLAELTPWAGLPHSNRRQTKPVVKPYRSWPRLTPYAPPNLWTSLWITPCPRAERTRSLHFDSYA